MVDQRIDKSIDGVRRGDHGDPYAMTTRNVGGDRSDASNSGWQQISSERSHPLINS